MESHKLWLCVLSFAVALVCAGCHPRPTQTYGTMRFYEGYNGSQNSFCAEVVPQRPWHFVKKMSDCGRNDEAKSMKFEGTPPGTRVKVYDSPDCGTGDDWADIVTLETATPSITVWNFEDNEADDARYLIRYHYQDGNLDGKVSCVIFDVPALP